MTEFEDDKLHVYIDNRHPAHDYAIIEDAGAVEVSRSENSVTLAVQTRAGEKHVELSLQRSERDRYWLTYRPTTAFVDGKRVWQSNRLDPVREREAVEYLRRRYPQMLLCTSDDDLLGAAKGRLQRVYFDDVAEAAAYLEGEVTDGSIEDRDAFQERLHEYIDGHQRVIYTHKAIECLMFSDNDGYAIENGLIGTDDFSDGIPWSALAYGAFEQDVLARLGRNGVVDVDDDNLGRPPRAEGFVFQGDTFCAEHCPVFDEDAADPHEKGTSIAEGKRFTCAECGDEFTAE
jgi:hypothetical protein